MNAKTAPLDDRPLRTEPIRPTGDAGDSWGRAAAYDAYADGLHTYAIWLLRDHDAAVDALYCTFVLADRHITQLRQPEHIQPWLYAIMRRECMLRMASGSTSEAASAADSSSSAGRRESSPSPVSGRLRPPGGPADPSGSLASLERNLRRAEFHSLEWPESEGLAPAHREVLELTIRHGLDSQGLGLVLGLGQSGRSGRSGGVGGAFGGAFGGAGVIGSVGSQGFGVLADAWRELERSLAAVAVAKASREHCAQLAELTFGWSGRLTAALRGPLTDHVDGCTRCQHYLHTVVGTPAAPTILPFVAAPRALREMLLSELRDTIIALRLGIDHDVIAARIQRFAPNGFPAVAEPAPTRRRGGRRAAPKGSGVAAKRKSTVAQASAAAAREGVSAAPSASDDAQAMGRTGTTEAAQILPTTQGGPTAQTPPAAESARAAERAQNTPTTQTPSDVLPRRTPGASERRADAHVRVNKDENADAVSVYRAPGSWAARVLPADTAMAWRPSTNPASSGNFISTSSGRFAARVPDSVEDTATTHTRAAGAGARAASSSASVNAANGPRAASATKASSAPPTARMPRLTAPEPEAPRDPDGKSRPPSARHKSRPMRQAVLSTVALGAVGAAAAAAAALLGVASDGRTPQLSDMAPPQDPVNTSSPGGERLSVSVSTPAAPGASSGVHASRTPSVGASGTAQGAGATGISGTVRDTASAGAGASSGPGVNAADFRVSVNQRDADPAHVTILLRNTGGTPIAWSAVTHDSWITLSRYSGTLAAGQSEAIIATATSAAPSGAWTSTVTFAPGGAVVTLRGVNGPVSGQTSPPASTPPTTAPPTSASPSPPAGTGTPSSPGSTSTPTPPPSASSSSAGGVGPSTTRPSRSVPASPAPSSSRSASPPATASSSGSASAPPPHRRRAGGY